MYLILTSTLFSFLHAYLAIVYNLLFIIFGTSFSFSDILIWYYLSDNLNVCCCETKCYFLFLLSPCLWGGEIEPGFSPFI